MKRKKYKEITYLNFNIKDKPEFKDYNITQGMLDNEIAKYNEKKDRLLKLKRKFENAKVWLWWIIPAVGINVYFILTQQMHWIACVLIGSMSGVCGPVVLCFINASINMRLESMDQISIDGNRVLDRYKRYRHDLACYETELNRRIQMQKEAYWTQMEGHKFEHEIAKLYNLHGYSVNVTKGSGDGGVDIVMKKDSLTYYVQCKNHSKPISPATARDLYGAMNSAGIKYGVIVSPRGFTKNVRNFAIGKNIELIEIRDILRMAEQVK